jgi:uroporphyrinogen decarboxylase
MENNRQRFYDVMAGKPADRLPLDLQLTPPVAKEVESQLGTPDPAKAFGSDTEYLWINYKYDRKEWVKAYKGIGVQIPENAIDYPMGIFFAPDSEASEANAHMAAHLHTLEDIDSVEQLESLPWPDLENPAHYADLKERIAAIHSRDRISVAVMDCTIFEHSWYLRGMDNLFADILEEEEVGFWLFDFFTRRSTVAVNRLAAAGVDVIRLGDDIGMQQGMLMAPDLWREHIKPRLAKIVAAAKAAGPSKILYHSDGNILPVIEDLIEIGVDILNPIQPECMSVQEVVTQYKDRLAFWGMIGTQTTLPFGKPEGIIEAVGEIYQLAAEGARCIVGPTHVVEPDVPWANLEALVSATLHPRFPSASATGGQS